MIKSLDQVSNTSTKRISSNCPEIDMLFGQDFTQLEFGLPLQSMTSLSGNSGVGKSKLAIKICKGFNQQKYKVIYYQLESTFSAFKNWTKDCIKNPNLFLLSDEIDTDNQIVEIKKVKPSLVVIDSVNMLLNSSNTHEVKKMLSKYREICVELNLQVLFLCQIAKDKTIAGSKDWLYIPDTIIEMNKQQQVKVIKNRFGVSNVSVNFLHTENGLEVSKE